MAQINLSLPDGLIAYIDDLVTSGHYNGRSDVVRDALRHLDQQDAW